MEEWSFYEHSFQFCKCGNDLIRVPINNWPIAVDITSFEDHNVCSMDMYCLWDKISCQCHYCDCFFRYAKKFNQHIKHCKNIFACLFSVHNTISLSRHEQVCLMRPRFEMFPLKMTR